MRKAAFIGLIVATVVSLAGCRRSGTPAPPPGKAGPGGEVSIDPGDKAAAERAGIGSEPGPDKVGTYTWEGGRIVEVTVNAAARKPPRTFNDGDIASLAGLAKLRKLSITYSPNPNFTGVGLRQLAGLKELTHLDLANCQLSDEGLREAATLSQLRFLRIQKASEANLSVLAGLTKLEELSINGCVVGGSAGVRIAQALPKLKRLDIGNNGQFGEQGFTAIATTMTKLQSLDMTGTGIGDRGLTLLPGLKKLENVSVSLPVTDEGMKSIAACQNLRSLQIFNTATTDQAFLEIAKLPWLENLKITIGTHGKITPHAITEFAKAHPKCKVTRGAGE